MWNRKRLIVLLTRVFEFCRATREKTKKKYYFKSIKTKLFAHSVSHSKWFFIAHFLIRIFWLKYKNFLDQIVQFDWWINLEFLKWEEWRRRSEGKWNGNKLRVGGNDNDNSRRQNENDAKEICLTRQEKPQMFFLASTDAAMCYSFCHSRPFQRPRSFSLIRSTFCHIRFTIELWIFFENEFRSSSNFFAFQNLFLFVSFCFDANNVCVHDLFRFLFLCLFLELIWAFRRFFAAFLVGSDVRWFDWFTRLQSVCLYFSSLLTTASKWNTNKLNSFSGSCHSVCLRILTTKRQKQTPKEMEEHAKWHRTTKEWQ